MKETRVPLRHGLAAILISGEFFDNDVSVPQKEKAPPPPKKKGK